MIIDILFSYWAWTSGITAVVMLLHATFYHEPEPMSEYLILIVAAPVLWAQLAFLTVFKPATLKDMMNGDNDE